MSTTGYHNWDICNSRLEAKHIITKTASAVTDQVSCVLGIDKITPESLRASIPQAHINQGVPGSSHYRQSWRRSMGIYHGDGRWAFYVGSSSHLESVQSVTYDKSTPYAQAPLPILVNSNAIRFSLKTDGLLRTTR